MMRSSTTFITLALCATFVGSPRLAAQEDLTTGTKPEPLVLERAAALPPTMMRWVVPASSRSAGESSRIQWMPGGQRMLANSMNGVQCWKPSAKGDALELEGKLTIGSWALSPDGRWLFASRRAQKGMPTWSLYRADTFEGLWTLRPPNITTSVAPVAFSPDGRWLVIIHDDERDRVFSIVDAETGARVQTVRPPATSKNRWRDAGACLVGRDALLLAARYDEQGRMTRIPYATWTPEFVSDPLGNPRFGLTLSKDERWLVCWDEAGYEAFERNGVRYTLKFQGAAETRLGTTAGLQSVKTSPDSTQLVISGNGKHKVIRMANQAVLHEAAAECMCGDFGPDGKRFWKTCSPFRAVNTASWQTLPDPVIGHHGDVHSVRFSPDGKRFATGSIGHFFVWSVNNLARPQELARARPRGCLAKLSWNENGTEVWAGDSSRFLRWKIPQTPSDKPIVGEDIFPSAPQRSEEMYVQFIEHVSPPGWCLTNGGSNGFGPAELRNPDKPGVVRRLKSVVLPDFVTTQRALSKDRTEVYYTAGGRVNAVNLATDTARVGDPGMGDVVGIGGQPERLVVMNDTRVILVDAATLKTVGEVQLPRGARYSSPSGGSHPAVSPDGRWLFCCVTPASNMYDMRPTLVDLAGLKLQSVLPPLDSQLHVAAFSPDSRMIAAGHVGGAVSLWNVANLATAGGSITLTDAEIAAAANTKIVRVVALPAGASTAAPANAGDNASTSVSVRSAPSKGPSASAGAWTESRAMEPMSFPLKCGETWVITPSGSVTNAASEFDGGRLFINDEPIKPRAIRTLRSPGEGMVMSREVEALAMEGKVRIHRLMRGTYTGSMRWIDTVQNLGGEPATLTLAFESALGGDVTQLLTRDKRTPAMQSGGVLDVAAPETMLVMKLPRQGGQRTAAVCFSAEEPPFYPTMKWNAATRSVRSEWTMRLEPFQRRTVVQLAQERHVAPETDAMSNLPMLDWVNMEDMNILARLPEVLNYAPGQFDKSFAAESIRKLQVVDPEGYQKDGMGFRWRDWTTWGEGMGAELGAERALELWLDGSPATFQRSIAALTTSRQYAQSGTTCLSAISPVRVTRRKTWLTQEGVLLMHDLLFNPTQDPVKCRLEIGVVASKGFSKLLSGDGRTLDITKPVPIPQCEGKIAIVGEGADQPAILVGVGDGHADAPPASVRWVNGRGVFVTYDLDLRAGQQVALLHFATQRPLGAYDTIAEGIAQLDVSHCIEVQAKLGQLAPRNWTAPPRPGAGGAKAE